MKLLEALPDEVVASIEVRDRWRRSLAENDAGLEFIVSDLSRWRPGSTVRVAFLDGDTALHADIEQAVQQIADECNLVLDFGMDPATGDYRRWTEADTEYAAEIRVSFDMGGYWSLVGTDSNDPTIGGPGSPIGGGPGQRSLNLSDFAVQKPADWEGTARHEFLHALSFHHAHQNLRGPCAEEFRWEDDPGYQPTQNARGVFIPDAQGRRPGIYTYLAGAPNRWSRAKVDHNLRTNVSDDVVVGPFDTDSVMLYEFEAFFYKTDPSPCAPTGNGIDLSTGDKRGLALLYPGADEAVEELSQSAAKAREALQGHGDEEGLAQESAYEKRVRELLEAWA
jgi:hypothetical protein